MIDSIIYRNDSGTFTLWQLDIPETELAKIEAILMKWDCRGCSITGTAEEIAEEVKTL